MSSADQQLLTAEDFALLPDSGKRRELVRGEVMETVSPNLQHSFIAAKIALLLGNWAMKEKRGFVGVEGGFIVEHGPDTVRLPDVAFIRAERLSAERLPSFGDFAPDLAVEVISPSERGSEIQKKVLEYLHAGSPLIWTVFPSTRTVVAHTPDGLSRTFRENDLLEFPEVLPGFRCTVREFFE